MALIDRVLLRIGVASRELVAFKAALEAVGEDGSLTLSGTIQGADLVATDDLTVGDDAAIGGDLAVTGATTHTGALNAATFGLAGAPAVGQHAAVADIANNATGTQIATAVNGILATLRLLGFVAP